MTTPASTLQAIVAADGRLELSQPLELPPGPVEITVTVAAAGDNGRNGSVQLPNSEPQIIERERGPCIAGTRVTVYSILDYYLDGWDANSIAPVLGLSSAQVSAAVRYIEDHKDAVLTGYQVILERAARGNPPKLQAKLDAIHAKWQAVWADQRSKAGMPQVNGEGTSGG